MSFTPLWLKKSFQALARRKKIIVPIVAAVALAGYAVCHRPEKGPVNLSVPLRASAFLSLVNMEDDQVLTKVDFYMSSDSGLVQVKGSLENDLNFESTLPAALLSDVTKSLQDNQIPFEVKRQEKGISGGTILALLVNVAFIAVLVKMMIQTGAIGKAKGLISKISDAGVTFDDVAGIDEVKAELSEVVGFLKNKKGYNDIGAQVPKGVLLSGPPGTGKTLLARAVAGESNVSFFSISGSSFVEIYVGTGAKRVRELFENAKQEAPAIIFIDELDAVGSRRDNGGGGTEEHAQTLNQLLVCMDGIEPNGDIVLIAATNRPEMLDPALLRPGRFDRKVHVSLPDLKGRAEILKIHTKHVLLHENVDMEAIARQTANFSGADLANLVNESALQAVRDGKNRVDMDSFDKARDKILLGLERPSMVMSEDQRRLTAYHEAGHALIGLLCDAGDKLEKVTIIPRGDALGLTVSSREDTSTMTVGQLRSRLVHLMGGERPRE